MSTKALNMANPAVPIGIAQPGQFARKPNSENSLDSDVSSVSSRAFSQESVGTQPCIPKSIQPRELNGRVDLAQKLPIKARKTSSKMSRLQIECLKRQASQLPPGDPSRIELEGKIFAATGKKVRF